MQAPNMQTQQQPQMPQGSGALAPNQSQQALKNNPKDRFQAMLQRANFLKNQGYTPANNPELDKIIKVFHAFQAASANQDPQSRGDMNGPSRPQPEVLVNGHSTSINGNSTSPAPTLITSGPVPSHPYPQSPPTPVSFTPDQINNLRTQIHAFKLISRGLPVPDAVQNVIRNPHHTTPELEKLLQGQDATAAKLVDSAVKIHKATEGSSAMETSETMKVEEPEIDPADLPKGPFLEDKVDSGIYPYNAYVHPFTHLQRKPAEDAKLYHTRLQRLLVPSLMPAGLDPHQIIAERNRFTDARIQQRILELEAMPATMGDGGFFSIAEEVSNVDKENFAEEKPNFSHPNSSTRGKLRAIIELRSLRVLERQRALRASVAERLTHGTNLPLNRVEFRRVRKPTVRDARQTETLERKQRADRERQAKQRHVAQLNVICSHGRELINANRFAQDKVSKIGKSVLSFHAHAEKEEQKRIERISKERLKALKADDEEAYMKLIDTAKDTRITHLLRQTDSYLDSLAQAVRAQQTDGPEAFAHFEQEEGPASEATFGAVSTLHEGEEKDKIDYYAVAHKIREKVTRQPGILVGGQLKEYQIKGLQWMVSLYNNKLNGILADEMGLGKTIQTISLITFLIETKKQRGPYLVIVPLTTMTNWCAEFAKWAPSVRMIAYKGNPAQRRALQAELRVGQFQVLLTTYEFIIRDRPHLSKLKWVHMIIDEGHRMKNTQSKLSQTLTQFYHTRHRLILTGTPLQNNLPELWALLNFVLPKIFNSVKSFEEWFNTPFANSGTGDKIELNEEEALLIIRRLHKVLRPFLLRRLKKDVEAELPDKVEKVIKVKMSALQTQLYKQMKKYKMIADGKDGKGKGTGGIKGLSNELMQLRKICQHPFLFDSVEDKMNPSGIINDTIVRSSGKIELLSRILPKLFHTGHRVLIFFQMTKVMDIMEDFMKMMNFKYLRLDGGTKTEERAGHVAMFNAPGSEYKVFILSTRAGGLGLNLQTADTVVIFDSDWNPHADLQAQDRAHRIGQTKTVRIFRFITDKSVEEAMYSRARYKLDIDDKVIQAGRFDNKSTQEEQEEFLRSILEADQDEEGEEAGDMGDEEINTILARTEEEETLFRDFDIAREREAIENWKATGHRGKPPPPLMQLEELPDCYKFDEPFELSDPIEEVEGRGQRRRTVVNYNDGLSDDQWAMALEDGEDINDLAERTRQARGMMGEDSVSGTPASDSLEPKRGRGRGRKGKSRADDVDSGPANGKRKRGVKAPSVTPSMNEDDDIERDSKRRKTKPKDMPPQLRDRMKRAFNECYRAVMNCDDETGRKRCELFKELPDKREYPDYYQLIQQPIALSHLRKRMNSNGYRTVVEFQDDFRLMCNNARTYNQEGSWVYVDAEEMEKVFDATYDRVMSGSGLPGAPGGMAGMSDSALTPMEEDLPPPPLPSKMKMGGRKLIISDDEYLTPSDEE